MLEIILRKAQVGACDVGTQTHRGLIGHLYRNLQHRYWERRTWHGCESETKLLLYRLNGEALDDGLQCGHS